MKCEHCELFERKTTDGATGWCKKRQVAVMLSDSCMAGEHDDSNYGGESRG